MGEPGDDKSHSFDSLLKRKHRAALYSTRLCSNRFIQKGPVHRHSGNRGEMTSVKYVLYTDTTRQTHS